MKHHVAQNLLRILMVFAQLRTAVVMRESHNGIHSLSSVRLAAKALGSSGCHIVLFTTGRGTPFGTFVPTMKISTNSNLAAHKPGWIDFNAGVIVEDEPMETTCRRFIDYVIQVASGEPVNNEKKNYREIAIFKNGVTL